MDLSPAPREYRAQDYNKVLRRWMRRGRIIHEFDTALDITAVALSADFRSAWVARYADMYKVTGRDRDQKLAEELREAASGNWFLVSAATSRYQWADFGKPDSIWRVTLVDDTLREVVAESMKRARTPPDELRVFYPFIGVFHDTYRLRFPKQLDGAPFPSPSTKYLVVRVSGPLGATELRWDVGAAP